MKFHRFRTYALAVATAAISAACAGNGGSQFSPSSVVQGATSAVQRAERHRTAGALGPVLTAAQNGTITGWDVDQNSGIGLLSAGYKNGTRLETFDLKSARIGKLGSFQAAGSGNVTRQYIVLRILANEVALVDDLNFHEKGFQRHDTFPTVSPVSKAKVTGRWTPPHYRNNLLVNPSVGWVAVNQDTPLDVAMVFRDVDRSQGGKLDLIVSDIAQDSFMHPPRLGRGAIFSIPYAVVEDTGANEAVLPMQIEGDPFNPFEPPSFDVDDLAKRTRTIFSPNLGSGSVMGAAVDSTTHIMCTTTNDDSNVEFINLTAKSGFAENLPDGVGEGSGGGAVAVDELNHLFIVTQPEGALLNSASIYVYDEQGNLQESIPGFDFSNASSAVFAYVAVNPKLRIGYVTTANPAQLQSFTY